MNSLRTKISPQDFFDIRRLKFQPKHLSVIDLPSVYNMEKAMSKWIESHLKKRYFIGKTVGLTKENKVESVLRVGFEDPKELSYFVLACPLLKYK
tara:strand:- start:2618 stop:2902 length:285 start_codon:yes stop_codon:yes gene_type:complete